MKVNYLRKTMKRLAKFILFMNIISEIKAASSEESKLSVNEYMIKDFLGTYEKEGSDIINLATQSPVAKNDWNVVCTYMNNSNDDNDHYFPDYIENFKPNISQEKLYLQSEGRHLQIETLTCKQPGYPPFYATATSKIKNKHGFHELTHLEKVHAGMIIKVNVEENQRVEETIDVITKRFSELHGGPNTNHIELQNCIPRSLYSTLCVQHWIGSDRYGGFTNKGLKRPIMVDGIQYYSDVLTCLTDQMDDEPISYIGVNIDHTLELVELKVDAIDIRDGIKYSIKDESKKGSSGSSKNVVGQLVKALKKSAANNEEWYQWLEIAPVPDYGLVKWCQLRNGDRSGKIKYASKERVHLLLMPYGENRDVTAVKCEIPNGKPILMVPTMKENTGFAKLEQVTGEDYIFQGNPNKEKMELDHIFYQIYDKEESTNGIVNLIKNVLPSELLEYKCHESLNYGLSIQRVEQRYHYVHTVEGKLELNNGRTITTDVVVCDSKTEETFHGTTNPYIPTLLTPVTLNEENSIEFEDGKAFTIDSRAEKFRRQFNKNKEDEKPHLLTLTDFTNVMKKRCALFKNYLTIDNVNQVLLHVEKLKLQPYHEKNLWSEILECRYRDSKKHPHVETIYPIFDDDVLSLVRKTNEEESNYELCMPQLENPDDISDLKPFETYRL